MYIIIESKDNKIIKKIKSLFTKKGRDELNQFIIEGEKFLYNIPENIIITNFILSESFYKNNSISYFESKGEISVIKDNLYNNLSNTINPQGIMAICNKFDYKLNDFLKENIFLIVIEDLQDPGNLGTLIRTADAGGATGILISKGSVDIYNPKVVRSTAGSIFNIPILENLEIDYILDFLKNNNIFILASHLKGEIFPFEINLNKNLAILIGNEGNGLSENTSNNADVLVKIPMLGKAESLNASMASGILLYEVVRQKILNKK